MLDPTKKILSPIIFGCIATELSEAEIDLFNDIRPFGLILFEHNCLNPTQLSDLIAQFREVVGYKDAPVLIDQEGGRVTRLKPPHWRLPPPANTFAEIAKENIEVALRAAYLNARMIGKELASVGISVNCLPVLDFPVVGAHEVIGDRALGRDSATIAKLGRSLCKGLIEEGVFPIIKHIPGHGRAKTDSHKNLPIVDASIQELEETDFVPFKLLNEMPWAMTAHVVYSAIDNKRAATISPIIINEIIRSKIGFEGLLVSDDIGMDALSGSKGERAQNILNGGCDLVLECSGNINDMQEISSKVSPMKEETIKRINLAEKFKLNNQINDSLSSLDALEEFEELITKFIP